jgi:hypothetical protein
VPGSRVAPGATDRQCKNRWFFGECHGGRVVGTTRRRALTSRYPARRGVRHLSAASSVFASMVSLPGAGCKNGEFMCRDREADLMTGVVLNGPLAAGFWAWEGEGGYGLLQSDTPKARMRPLGTVSSALSTSRTGSDVGYSHKADVALCTSHRWRMSLGWSV